MDVSGRMAQLLHRETSCFVFPRSGFTRVQFLVYFYHEVNIVLWILITNVLRIIIMHEVHEPQLYQLNHHSSAQSGAEHGLLILLRGPLNCIGYWPIGILLLVVISLTSYLLSFPFLLLEINVMLLYVMLCITNDCMEDVIYISRMQKE